MGEVAYPSVAVASDLPARTDFRVTVPPFVFAITAVAGLGAANGGYFPSSWGWAALAFSMVLMWAGVTVSTRWSRAEVVFATALAGFAVLALASVVTRTPHRVDEFARVLVYVAGVSASLALVRRASVVPLLAGVVTGISGVGAYAIATRCFPDRIGSFDSTAAYRLSAPLGYWNALGLLCAVGLLLSLALVVRAPSPVKAALAALPMPMLAAALYFTFSRGSWISLGAGLASAVVLETRRLRLVAAAVILGMPSALGVIASSRSDALTHKFVTATNAAQQGHRLVWILLALSLASAAVAAGFIAASARVRVPSAVTRGSDIALAVIALAAIVGSIAHAGGPRAAATRVWNSFAAQPPTVRADLQDRLFTFSGNGRVYLWHAAVRDFHAHPWTGSGPGSYEAYWLLHRPNHIKVRDAHSLYIETLAEFGVIGLALLLVALLTPLYAAIRVRRKPWVGAAAGAYVAYLVGAGVDWDWEVPAVTLAALLTGVAILVAHRRAGNPGISSRMRYVLVGAAVPIFAFAFIFLVGHMKLTRATAAAADARWSQSARDSRSAASWLPWSAQPWQQLGEAQLANGDTHAARASFNKAIAKDSGDWSVWFDLARASTGQAQKIALTRATRLNPLSAEITELKRELENAGTINGS